MICLRHKTTNHSANLKRYAKESHLSFLYMQYFSVYGKLISRIKCGDNFWEVQTYSLISSSFFVKFLGKFY